jgi:hypothetical protein
MRGFVAAPLKWGGGAMLQTQVLGRWICLISYGLNHKLRTLVNVQWVTVMTSLVHIKALTITNATL